MHDPAEARAVDRDEATAPEGDVVKDVAEVLEKAEDRPADPHLPPARIDRQTSSNRWIPADFFFDLSARETPEQASPLCGGACFL